MSIWISVPTVGTAADIHYADTLAANISMSDLSTPFPQQNGNPVNPTGAFKVFLPLITDGYGSSIQGPTYYVDGTNGNDAYNGSQNAPWKTVQHAISTIKAGDTVIIRAGIYRASYYGFGPAGVPAKLTTFRAAPNARVILTTPSDVPPSIQMADYVRVDGLWFGGNRNTNVLQQGFSPGGTPIGNGKEIVNNTFFNFNEGMSGGSLQNTLIQSNRFVNTGQLVNQKHAVYLSGDDASGTGGASTHLIIDNNIIIGGEGYGIQGWHIVHNLIYTRNMVTNHNWGVVADGSDHLIANNFFWKEKGDNGTYPWGEYVAGTSTLTYNNIFGVNGWITTDSVAIDPASQNAFENNAFNTFNMPPYWPVQPTGRNQVLLATGQEASQLGISAQSLDASIAALQNSFSQPIATIYRDQTIETNFAIIRSATIPVSSPLYRTGKQWFDTNTPMNIGPNASVPATSVAFWIAFRALGLTEYDRFGNVIRP